MKKITILFISIFCFTAATQAQCIKFELAGNTLSTNLPQVNADGTMLIFQQQVVTKIAKVEEGKFEQVDYTSFTIPVKGFDPLTVNQVAADSAAAYVERTYPDIK